MILYINNFHEIDYHKFVISVEKDLLNISSGFYLPSFKRIYFCYLILIN